MTTNWSLSLSVNDYNSSGFRTKTTFKELKMKKKEEDEKISVYLPVGRGRR